MDYRSYWDRAIDYSTYRETIDGLLEEGKTTGANQSEAMIDYTRMSVQRMKRWDKTYNPSEDLLSVLEGYSAKENWLVITEAWCGDAAQIIPALSKISESTEKITLKLIWRDENLELMDAHLTNGVARSIPILIRLDEEFNLIDQWGPRPATGQKIIMDAKANNSDAKLAKQELHLWYARNKQTELEEEIRAILQPEVVYQ
jgi:hypothetical protein